MSFVPAPDEAAYFEALWQVADVGRTGQLAGRLAVEFFRQSGLDTTVLRQVWGLADAAMQRFLGRAEFFVALRLISMAQRGVPLSEHALAGQAGVRLPLPRFAGLEGPYAMTAEERDNYERLFPMFVPSGAAFISGPDAAALFRKSGLDTAVLKKVWDLSDVDKDGQLTVAEFTLAMHLIVCVSKRGKPVPEFCTIEVMAAVGLPYTGPIRPGDARVQFRQSGPVGVWAFGKMTTLNLSSNALVELPAGALRTMTALETLKLDHNKLVALPEFSACVKLATLAASHNRLTAEALAGLPPTLTKLNLSDNRIATLEAPLPPLAKLAVLDLSSNQIASVPASLVPLLPAVIELVLDSNAVEVLPPEVGAWRKLKVLSLRGNRVTGEIVVGMQPLPAALFTDTSLERLNLESNPITRRQLNNFDGVGDWLERRAKTKQKDIGLYMMD